MPPTPVRSSASGNLFFRNRYYWTNPQLAPPLHRAEHENTTRHTAPDRRHLWGCNAAQRASNISWAQTLLTKRLDLSKSTAVTMLSAVVMSRMSVPICSRLPALADPRCLARPGSLRKECTFIFTAGQATMALPAAAGCFGNVATFQGQQLFGWNPYYGYCCPHSGYL